jgi:hypothetical protein
MAIDFNSVESIIGGFDKVLSLGNLGGVTSIPVILILVGVAKRPGLSATKIASRIISRKSEAGIPVGALPSGGPSPDEQMERIRIEEIIKAFQQEAVITVAIPPGITVSASGIGPTGPVTVAGMTVYYAKGYGVIQ